MKIAFFIACIFGSLPASASKAQLTESTIRATVEQAYRTEIAQLAQFHKWPEYTLNYHIRVPAAANHLPACQSPLVVNGRDHQSFPIGNLRRAISCDDVTQPWRMNVSLKATLTLPIVVTKTAIQRGDTVNASVLALETRTLTRGDTFFTAIDDASGHLANRRIRAGHILNPETLSAIPLVEKGNEVVIIAIKDGFTASTKGIGLEQGKKGEQIDVQNISSGKIIRTVVTGLNQVNTQF